MNKEELKEKYGFVNEEMLLMNIFGEGEYVPDGTEEKFIKAELYWGWCRMCGAYLRCPKCGNNLCNGGSGYLDEERTQKCDLCIHMYSLQDFFCKKDVKKYPEREDFINLVLDKGNKKSMIQNN